MRNEWAGNASLSESAARSVGYCSDPLRFTGRHIHFGRHVTSVHLGGLDNTPGEVEEVRLVIPERKHSNKNDYALIRCRKTRQIFGEGRVIVEWTNDEMGWSGESPSGETVCVMPSTTYSLKTRKNEGSIVYGGGWKGAWTTMTNESGTIIEGCYPAFKEDGRVQELEEGDPRASALFWGLLRCLRK